RFTIATSSRCPVATSPASTKTSSSLATRSPIGTSKRKATDLQCQRPNALLVGPHMHRACRPDEGRLTDNVKDHLPQRLRSSVGRRMMTDAYHAGSALERSSAAHPGQRTRPYPPRRGGQP